ncbi:MAG: hypothetical protein FJ088_03085 [Deltaproteobacteria bacterium]|nr:hypothetical protein [Deltaproteobacteria bacterium]
MKKTSGEKLKELLLGYIERNGNKMDDSAFLEIASEIFSFQRKHNHVYKDYLKETGFRKRTIKKLSDIPPFPEAGFKITESAAFNPSSAERVFVTSGTTTGAGGRHFVRDLDIYRRSIDNSFGAFCMNGRKKMPMLSMIPPGELRRDSSLSFMTSHVIERFGAKGSGFYSSGSGIEELLDALRIGSRSNEPVMLLGTAIDFHNLCKAAEMNKEAAVLPENSLVFETGGFKGRKEAISKKALYEKIKEVFNVGEEQIIGEFGMTELLSQAYDVVSQFKRERYFLPASTLSVRVVNPLTLEDAAEGEEGLIVHYDICNIYTNAAILTGDAGVRVGGGFIVKGRAMYAEPRGCSLDAGSRDE